MTTEQFNFIDYFRHLFVSCYHFNDDVSIWFASLFALESNYGNSLLAKEHNNLCSMKCPKVRISVCSNFGSDDIWATYVSHTICVLDFVLWLQYQRPLRKELESPELLYSYFRKYCPEKDYISKINRIYQQFKSCYHER